MKSLTQRRGDAKSAEGIKGIKRLSQRHGGHGGHGGIKREEESTNYTNGHE